jgi:hypothetical protein
MHIEEPELRSVLSGCGANRRLRDALNWHFSCSFVDLSAAPRCRNTEQKQTCRGIQFGMRTLLVAALMLAAAVVPAQSHAMKGHGKDELRFTLVLPRHGVCPHTVAASALVIYSSDPWPKWEVPK